MAAVQEAMKEKELAAKSQEMLLTLPRRGRGHIKGLVFACLFRSLKALVAKAFGFLLGRSTTYTPTSQVTAPIFA